LNEGYVGYDPNIGQGLCPEYWTQV